MVAFSPHGDQAWVIATGETVELKHTLHFTRE